MSFIVIEGDNGTGKTTVANMFRDVGYRVISEDEDIVNLSISSKKLPPGSKERFEAFIKYNVICCERSLKYDNSVIVRSWISTVSAAYADGQMSMEDALKMAMALYKDFPVPNKIFRLTCDFDVRVKRVFVRSVMTNDKSDDMSKKRNKKYEEILSEIKKMFKGIWMDIDTTELLPQEVFEIMIKNVNG